MVLAAIHLLETDDRLRRLSGEDPAVAVAHRAAVERTSTTAELAVVERVLDDRVQGCVAAFVAGELGGPAPSSDDELEALTVILGRRGR